MSAVKPKPSRDEVAHLIEGESDRLREVRRALFALHLACSIPALDHDILECMADLDKAVDRLAPWRKVL